MMIRLLVTAFLLLLILLPSYGWAAIAYVSHTESAASINVSSITTSLTVSAGTDRAAYFCSQMRNSSTTRTVSSVVFNGSESFTLIRADERASADDGSWLRTELWKAAGLTVTTANVVATYSGTVNRGVGYSVDQFTGVSQTSPVDSHAGSSGNSTTPSAIITTVADNAAIVDCVYGRSGGSGMTVGAGQTVRTDRLLGGAFADGAGASTVVGKTPAGDETMNWTQPTEGDMTWVISAVSIPPSGGADPTPVVNGQVTITWTNGTDPGSNASGISNTTIRRCTGTGCACPTTGPGIGSVSYPLTTYVDTTVAVDTTYGYCGLHSDVAGNPSINSGIAYVTTSATPPDAPPTITGLVLDPAGTGANLTFGAVTPTEIEVNTFTNLGVVSSVKHPISDFPGGRYDEEFIDGLDGVCFVPIDAAGIKNTNQDDSRCDSLVGIVEPFDTTPPVITCAALGDLPAGTTEWPFSCQVNKVSSGKYDTTDVAFASMANSLALNSLTFSGTASGLTNGSTTTLYLRAQLTGLNDEVYPALTSEVLTITVASSTADTTPPGDVANLACTIIGNAASCTWDAASDAVSYQMFQGDGACSTFAPAGSPVATTNLQLGLSFGTTYCWKVKALDAVNNFSTNFSNTQTKTTLAQPDIEPPSDLEGLRIDVFTNSVRASWILGSDNIGPVSVNLEYCLAEVGQTDCANFNVNISKIGQSFLTLNLSPGRWYCFRGKNADGAGNVSVNYPAAVCAQTATTGLGAPRVEIPFGVSRLPLALPRLPNATTRIPVP